MGALLVAPLVAPGAAPGQASAGAQLWRVVTTTLPLPPALASGTVGLIWNPAQPEPAGKAAVALEVVQTPSAIAASAVLTGVRVRVGRVGTLGVAYGRVQLNDLVRTSQTPDPEPGSIPCYTQIGGVTWARAVAGTTLGATVSVHETQVDDLMGRRVTLDAGITQSIGAEDTWRLALATHSLRAAAGHPAQDVYAAIERRLWRSARAARADATGAASLWARYGATLGRGFAPDHLLGLGLVLGGGFRADILLAAEGSYDQRGWRPVGGFRLAIGRYELTFARDAGMRGLGSAYRVGLERRVP